jgi:hypothetical protein
MPFANSLNPAEPAGGDQARFLDDAIRDLTNAVRERLATIVEDVDADPMVLSVSAPIADDSVTNVKMADASVGTAELIGLSVTEPKMADNAVSNRVLISDSVDQRVLGPLSVGTPELIDSNVTNVKLADDAVDQRTLADISVGTPQLIDASVTDPKYADASINQPKISVALQALLTTMVMAQRLLTQAETSVLDGVYIEYDINCAGAQVGKPVMVQWSNSGYPNPVATFGGWQPGDGLLLRAWCITADKIRIRIVNRTGGNVDMGPTGATVVVAQVKYLDNH